MFNMLTVFAEGEAAAQQAAGGMAGGLGLIIFYVIIIAVMYLILFLPQKKERKRFAAMIAELKVGDEIVTVGGLVGKIASIKDDTVVIENGADKVKLTFEKNSIRNVKKS